MGETSRQLQGVIKLLESPWNDISRVHWCTRIFVHLIASSNINFSESSPVHFRICNLARLELKESVTTLHSSLRPREDLSVECRSRDPTRLRGRPRGKRTRTSPTALQRGVLFYDRPTALPPPLPPLLPLGKSPPAAPPSLLSRAGMTRIEDATRSGTRNEVRMGRRRASRGAQGGKEGGREEQGRDGMDVDCIDTDRIKRNKIAARNANAREELPLVIHSLASAWRTTGCTLSLSFSQYGGIGQNSRRLIHRSIDRSIARSLAFDRFDAAAIDFRGHPALPARPTR